MSFSAVIPIVLLFAVMAIVLRLIAGWSDRTRIEGEIDSRGGHVVSITWQPFGKGWWGEKNERIYSVVYVDREGFRHEAFCKTSLWSGVYFADDRVIGGVGPPVPPATPGLPRSWGRGQDGPGATQGASLAREAEMQREIDRLQAENEALRERERREQ